MSKDEDDVLNQEQIAYNRAKDFCKKLTKNLEDYLKEKDDLAKYIMWDRIKSD